MKRKEKVTISSIIGVLVLVLLALLGKNFLLTDTVNDAPLRRAPADSPSSHSTGTSTAAGAETIARFHRNRSSGEMVEFEGVVIKSLPDDQEGDRHQRFIVELAGGHTVLIAHNIDLAPRVPLREGDAVIIFGQYEWSDRGGTVHWTHHDPRARREGGWIEHAGKRYE